MLKPFRNRELPVLFRVVFVGVPAKGDGLAFDEYGIVGVLDKLVDGIQSAFNGGKRTSLWVIPTIRSLVGGDDYNLGIKDTGSTLNLDVHGVAVEELEKKGVLQPAVEVV